MITVRDNPEKSRYEIHDGDDLAFCPYVRKVIAAGLEQYLDLVPASQRERFDLPQDPS